MFNGKNFSIIKRRKKIKKFQVLRKHCCKVNRNFFNKFFIIIIEYFRLVVRLPAKAMKVMNKFQQQQQQQTEKPFDLTKKLTVQIELNLLHLYFMMMTINIGFHFNSKFFFAVVMFFFYNEDRL